MRDVDPDLPGSDPERFRKANHILLPNSGRVVRVDDPVRWYFELYEIGLQAHRIRFDVLDGFGHAVLSHTRDFGAYRDNARFIEGIPLRNLPPGTYTLRVTAEAGDQNATNERSFQLEGPIRIPDHFDATRQGHLRLLLAAAAGEQVLSRFDGLDAEGRARLGYGYWLERNPLLASTYVGHLTGLGHHDVRLPLLRALKHQGTLKKRVDRTFGERIAEPDTSSVRLARERLDVVLRYDKNDAIALTGDALLALETGLLSEGEVYAKKALKQLPDFAPAQYAVGLSKVGRSDWDEADRRFSLAAASDPGWGGPMLNAELARFLSGKGNADIELDHLRKSAVFDLTHPGIYYVAGRLLERRDRLRE